jgi:hypothetical protein
MVIDTLLEEYGDLSSVPEQAIVVRQSAPTFEADAKGWLAFSPTLARSLGWRLASDGLFRWVDSRGAVMAESVWWNDGFIDHQPPDSDCEVGAGWLVVVSRDAVQAVRNAVGPLVLDGLLIRSCRQDETERESQHAKTTSAADVPGLEFLGP